MKFIKKGKVKKMYVFTEEEVANMWSLMFDGVTWNKERNDILSDVYKERETEIWKLLDDNGYFNRLTEKLNRR